MKKLFGLLGFLVIFIFPVMAQSTTAPFDVSGGYNLRIFKEPSGVRQGMNGWYGSLDYNIFRWLGVEGEITGAYRNNGLQGNTSLYTGLVGPRFYPFGHRKMTIFGHFLAGEALYRVHFPAFGGFPSEVDTQWYSSWETGGGVEYRRSARWKIRVIQVDYGQTHFYGGTQNNYRASIGVVYSFGKK
jgi:Outer membrane protein beta-barrel domain